MQKGPWPYFCVILEGDIQVSKIGKGVLGRLSQADWFGDMRSPNALATLITLSNSMLVKISSVDLAAAATASETQSPPGVLPAIKSQESLSLDTFEFFDAALGEGTFGKANDLSEGVFSSSEL